MLQWVPMDSEAIEQLLPPAGSPQSLIFLWAGGGGIQDHHLEFMEEFKVSFFIVV